MINNYHVNIAKVLIKKLKLDLKNLEVLTECASKGYAYTPIIAALAGAKSVTTVGSDSSHGSFTDNVENILQIAKNLSIDNSIFKFIEKKNLIENDLSSFDIITNSGQLRPIDSSIIKKLKKTAVITLMWETWEFREEDLDIIACQKVGIPVIGTNENFPEISMYGYNPLIVIKLLFDLGLEAYNNDIILLGGCKSGSAAFKGLKKLGFRISWYTKEGEDESFKYSELDNIYSNKNIDAIINFEHSAREKIIGKGGILNLKELITQFPNVKYGHICGNVNQKELETSGINFLPKKILPFGYMSYETMNLGYRPVLELAAAGLKVGEIAARARIKGETIEQTIKRTVDYGIGQDFNGGFLNYNI
jgi:hypothetical protein